MPRTATRRCNGTLQGVPLDDIAPGGRLLIRQGDVVPVDGRIALLRPSSAPWRCWANPLPVRIGRRAEAMSGSANAGAAFDLAVTREAKDSTCAGIVRLAVKVQASKAPRARLACRRSRGDLAVTATIAFAARWFTGDPIQALAMPVQPRLAP